MNLISVMPWADWLALGLFFGLWIAYAWYAQRGHTSGTTLLARTNRYRHYWLMQATYRDPRMLDGLVVQGLSSTPSFFSSTTIIIIGGVFALLGVTERANELVSELPFAEAAPVAVFDLKVLLLLSVFVYAFFRFTWAMRLNTFVALAIGSMPPSVDFAAGKFDREVHARRASRLVGLAAEAFNSGLRAYYMSFAVIAWFFSSLAFMLGSLLVIGILYRREFQSDVLDVLTDSMAEKK